MRPIDKMELLDRIGAELQGQMTFNDISIYLEQHGVDLERGHYDEYSSKRVYAKDKLSFADDSIVERIAEELQITFDRGPSVLSAQESSFWRPGYYRVFLSHISAFKEKASALQAALAWFGVSAFVAHEDIEPTREWQSEIEVALRSMDAMVPLLVPGFQESAWCDQEVGCAVALGVPVVPVRKGLDPYGFIGKFQAIQGAGKSVGDVAQLVFMGLCSSGSSRLKVTRALAFSIGNCVTAQDGERMLTNLMSCEEVPEESLAELRASVERNSVLGADKNFVRKVNGLLTAKQLEPIGGSSPEESDEDIPF